MNKPDRMFEKAAFGYRPDDVDRYVEELNQRIHVLEVEKQDLIGKMKILADKINEYRSEESNLKDALLGAQKMGNAIVAEAKTKADMMLTDAKTRSDRMVYEAQKTAEETIGSIKQQAEREKVILVKMQREVSDFKARLLSIYKNHLNVITALPELDSESEAYYQSKVKAETAEEKEKEAEQEVEEAAAAEPEVQPEEPQTDEAEFSSTVRLDKMPANAAINNPPRKSSFEEKFGELKFGKNSR